MKASGGGDAERPIRLRNDGAIGTSSDLSARWFGRRLSAEVGRIVAFPAAGGGVGPFAAWRRWLPDGLAVVPVRHAGRESRLGEAFADDLVELSHRVAEAIRTIDDLPFALVGHCFGSAIALETARRLEESDGPRPTALFAVDGTHPCTWARSGAVMPSTDEELVTLLIKNGMTPPQVLSSSSFATAYFPAVRADYQMMMRYRYEPADQLRSSIVLVGTKARGIGNDQRSAWRAETAASFACVELKSDRGDALSSSELAASIGETFLSALGSKERS